MLELPDTLCEMHRAPDRAVTRDASGTTDPDVNKIRGENPPARTLHTGGNPFYAASRINFTSPSYSPEGACEAA